MEHGVGFCRGHSNWQGFLGGGESKGDKTTQSPRRHSARSCPGEEVSAAVEGERVRCV